MQIILNGESRDVAPGTTVEQLVEQLNLTGRRLAVEVDREIVSRSAYAETVLGEGARVEIVHAIGGG